MSDRADDFFRSGDEPDVRGGRYHLTDPETGEAATWTRASNVGAVLADRFALERWARRRLLRGLGERPDLLDLLRAMVEYDDAKLDEVAETALQVAAATGAANLGTTIHEVQLRVDRGLEVPEGLERYAEGYRACLERHGLTAVVREARVINRGLGTAGRTDGIYRESDGTLVVGDAKSTGHLELSVPEVAPQLAAYATAGWIELSGDGGGWTRMGPVRTDYAVVFHVDRETGATAAYRVDLHLGAFGANLSGQVREYRRMGRAMLAPYVRPEGRPAPAPQRAPGAGPADRHLAAVPDPAPGPDAPLTREDLGAAEEHAAQARTAPPMATEAELLRMTKAQAQQYGRDRGVADVAHNRPQLVPIYRAAGILADDGPARPDASKDPAELTGTVGGRDHTDPRRPEFAEEALRRIAAAPTVAALAEVHRQVVRMGGDQAWSDAMAEAARERANAVDAANPNHAALSRVLACTTQEDLARLWDELTVGGSRAEGWPDEVNAAARERMRQIEAARPPAPANPFGASS